MCIQAAVEDNPDRYHVTEITTGSKFSRAAAVLLDFILSIFRSRNKIFLASILVYRQKLESRVVHVTKWHYVLVGILMTFLQLLMN